MANKSKLLEIGESTCASASPDISDDFSCAVALGQNEMTSQIGKLLKPNQRLMVKATSTSLRSMVIPDNHAEGLAQAGRGRNYSDKVRAVVSAAFQRSRSDEDVYMHSISQSDSFEYEQLTGALVNKHGDSWYKLSESQLQATTLAHYHSSRSSTCLADSRAQPGKQAAGTMMVAPPAADSTGMVKRKRENSKLPVTVTGHHSGSSSAMLTTVHNSGSVVSEISLQQRPRSKPPTLSREEGAATGNQYPTHPLDDGLDYLDIFSDYQQDTFLPEEFSSLPVIEDNNLSGKSTQPKD
jgi:hypothetical protein